MLKKLRIGENAFHIKSQIQADGFYCSFYCFEFIKILYNIYKEKGDEEFNNHLKKFFTQKNDSEFYVDYETKNSNKICRFGLLPPELFVYFQSFDFLFNLEKILNRRRIPTRS